MRSKAERRQIVEETLKSGASVAQIARAHGVNANQVFNWRRLYNAGQLETELAAGKLLPVKIADAAPAVWFTGCSPRMASFSIPARLGPPLPDLRSNESR